LLQHVDADVAGFEYFARGSALSTDLLECRGDQVLLNGIEVNALTSTERPDDECPNLTFALKSHFRSPSRRIPFAFNVATAETG
jgi:hypothetical protein